LGDKGPAGVRPAKYIACGTIALPLRLQSHAIVSMIMVIDGARVVLFDGLPASASRLL
jgi:hypothetical protein